MTALVRVPVLSMTTVSMPWARSNAWGPRMSTPMRAPRPVPASNASGVASPNAHGQAMMSTEMAAVRAADTCPVASIHTTKVSTAMPMTAGTKTAEILSARSWLAERPVWASSMRRAMWASWVSSPTAVACTTSRPELLIAEPTTASPGPTSTGTDSPVSIELSTAERPSTTVPSALTRSPGRTTNRSPTPRAAMGRSTSVPSLVSRWTVVGRMSNRACSAEPASALLRCSM